MGRRETTVETWEEAVGAAVMLILLMTSIVELSSPRHDAVRP